MTDVNSSVCSDSASEYVFFRRAGKSVTREAAWADQAASLGLSACTDGPDLLRDCLDLDSTPLASEVYRAADTGDLSIYVFDFLSDDRQQSRPELTAACLLVAEEAFCPVPLRIERQLRSQLAGIQAGASQAEVVVTGAPDGFDQRVTVVARDVAAARRLLPSTVRQALEKLLDRFPAAPTLTLSDRQLLAQVRADQFDLADLEYLMAGLMTVYLAVGSAAANLQD